MYTYTRAAESIIAYMHLLHTADFGLATPTTKTNSARLGTAKVGNNMININSFCHHVRCYPYDTETLCIVDGTRGGFRDAVYGECGCLVYGHYHD